MRLFQIAACALLFAGCAGLFLDPEWRDAGFEPEEYARAQAWSDMGVTPKNAIAWEKAGFTPSYSDTSGDHEAQKMVNDRIFGVQPKEWDKSKITPRELSDLLRIGVPRNRDDAVSPASLERLKSIGAKTSEWRYLLDSSVIYEKNYDIETIKSLAKLGVPYSEINRFRIIKREKSSGFSGKEALSFVKAGVLTADEAAKSEVGRRTLEQYLSEKAGQRSGGSSDWSYCLMRKMSESDVAAWSKAGAKCTKSEPWDFIDAQITPVEGAKWLNMGFDGAEAAIYTRNGIGVSEAARYRAAFRSEAIMDSEIVAWRKAGFAPQSAVEWRKITRNITLARGYKNQNLPYDSITKLLIDNGVEASAGARARSRIVSQCAGLNFSSRAFITRSEDSSRLANPDDAIGKCFVLSGFERTRGLAKSVSLYRLNFEHRRSSDEDGFIAIGFDGDTLGALNNNAVVKAEDTIFIPQIGTIVRAKAIWRR
ncbi:hypothetical protein FACS189487_08650 [Campylobacterota bacterium]|nr:hypothetical protein FACS189487_08650 [Campylobacterota bacterium]